MALRSDYRDESKPTVLSSSKVRKEYEHLVKGLKTSLETLAKDEKDS